ncbi:MAG: hypothetical protein U9R19_02905 [Bacteroidota bacterium]|nr:hypothetical protein [Bacteroidota bacterium]
MEELIAGTRVDHDIYGEGIVSKVNLTNYEIFFATRGKMEISKRNDDLHAIETPENTSIGNSLTLPQIDEAISYVLDRFGALQEVIPLGEKWHGGTMILKPADPNLQSKEIPIEAFFHKIVMLRDRLRVLEQNINSNKVLSDEDKVHLQQYISRAYGSLTTFNVLFSEKPHYFKGAGK